MKQKTNNKVQKEVNINNFAQIKLLLTSLELRRDLLIEHLHIIQDHFGYIS